MSYSPLGSENWYYQQEEVLTQDNTPEKQDLPNNQILPILTKINKSDSLSCNSIIGDVNDEFTCHNDSNEELS